MASGEDGRPSSKPPAQPPVNGPATSERAVGVDDKPKPEKVREIGGPKGPEPTRYGDWEKGGRCSDF